MSNAICGHDREALIWALKLRISVDNAGHLPFTMGGKVSPDESRNAAFRDANDHVKLASLITGALVHEPWFFDCMANGGESIELSYRIPGDTAHRTVDMVEACRILLAILEGAADKLAVVRGDR